MITRRYRCLKCGHEFEFETFESQREIEEWLHRNSGRQPGKIICPKCRGPVRRA